MPVSFFAYLVFFGEAIYNREMTIEREALEWKIRINFWIY